MDENSLPDCSKDIVYKIYHQCHQLFWTLGTSTSYKYSCSTFNNRIVKVMKISQYSFWFLKHPKKQNQITTNPYNQVLWCTSNLCLLLGFHSKLQEVDRIRVKITFWYIWCTQLYKGCWIIFYFFTFFINSNSFNVVHYKTIQK